MTLDSRTVDVSISMTTHVGDDATETDDLTALEYGVHCRLRRALWRRSGVLDGDRPRLRLLVGALTDADAVALETVISRLWVATEDGRIAHPATMAEIERARAKKATYIARGRAGGSAPHPTQRPSTGRAEVELKSSLAGAEGRAGAEPPPPPPPPPPTPTPDPPPPPEPDLDTRDHLKEDPCPAGGPAGPAGVGDDGPVLTLVPGGSDPEATKSREPTKPDSVHAVYAVFKHYREKHHHERRYRRPKDSKAWPLVQARLRAGYTVAELCQAIDGYHKSPHHLGQNSAGTVYLDLELIMRDETHVDHGLEWAENPPTPATAGRDPRVGHGRAEDYQHTQTGVIPI